MPIQFDRPGWLLLVLLVVPVIFMAARGLRRKRGRGRAIASTIARCVLVMLLAMAMARPIWERTGQGTSLIVLLDRSRSIPRAMQDEAVATLQRWTEPSRRGDGDRLAVIGVGEDAVIGSMPDSATLLEPPPHEPGDAATNLAAGMRLAMALLPGDTTARVLVVSDGNETDDSLLAMATLARTNGVPVDVLPLRFTHDQEVLVQQIDAPAHARPGQVIPVRVVLRSIAPASGTLYLHRNGRSIDLSPGEKGDGVRLSLDSGVRAAVFDLPVEQGGPQRFEATWEPASSAGDAIAANNTGVAVTFSSRQGAVLLVTNDTAAAQPFLDAMSSAGIHIDVRSPAIMPRDSVAMSAYDAVVLDNVPRWEIDDAQEQHLHAFVHDLGGGLILVGGPTSFGAGGWIGSQLEQAMPIECEPPQTRQLPQGALALIMHSCEMPQGNYWGQQVASAAVDALSSKDFVGIIEYNWNGSALGINNAAWTLPMQLAGDKQAAMDAVNSLVLGDMQDFESPMQLALDGLLSVPAAQRHAIIISDGDPQPPTQGLLEAYGEAGVTVSTVMVGGHGTAVDRQRMKGVAAATGGRFYEVSDPTLLPRIFIKESQLNARALIQEGPSFQAVAAAVTPGPLRGITTVPSVQGYVVTAARAGLAQTPWIIPTTDAEDPLFAWWHYGIGKSIAFTSDFGSRWARTWPQWEGYAVFWERSIRWAMRGSAPSNMLVNTRIEGDRGILDLEAVDADSSFLNFLETRGVVIGPDGNASPVSLQQTGPGRYHAEFPVDAPGAWLANIAFRSADGASGSIQAAVAVPYPREFRATSHNAALLHELADRTGGRVLQIADEQSVDLFDDTGLEVPRSPRPIWDLLAIIAAAWLVIDVAIRRLWIDRRDMQSLLAPVRETTTASLDALRKVKSVSAPRHDPDPSQDEIPVENPQRKETPREIDVDRDDALGRLLAKKRKQDEGDDA